MKVLSLRAAASAQVVFAVMFVELSNTATARLDANALIREIDRLLATHFQPGNNLDRSRNDHDLQPRPAAEQHGVGHVIVIGLLANTCAESAGRFAMELGYHVTLVTAAAMHTAHVVNGSTYAHQIVTADALASALDRAPPDHLLQGFIV